jgi:hypothetical protein
MIRLITCLLISSLAWAGVSCSSGTWSGTTCTGGSHPLTYSVTCNSSGVGTPSEVRAVSADSQQGDTIALQTTNNGNTCAWAFGDTAASDQYAVVSGCKSGTGTLTITSDNAASLPNSGTRITPAYLPLMPIIQTTNITKPLLMLASGGCPATNVTIRGIHFRAGTSQTNTNQHAGGLILVGYNEKYSTTTTLPYYPETTVTVQNTVDGSADTLTVGNSSWAVAGQVVAIQSAFGSRFELKTVDTVPSGTTIEFTTPFTVVHNVGDRLNVQVRSSDQQPTGITIQHNVFTNRIGPHFIRAAIGLHARAATIRDNWIEGIMEHAGDSQGIIGYNGVGPYTIENNTILGTSENVMFGGEGPSIDGQVDSAAIRWNTFAKYKEKDYTGVYRTNVIVHKGSYVYGSDQGAGGGWFRALNTGLTGSTEPTWNRSTAHLWPTGQTVGAVTGTGSVTTDSGGIQWVYTGVSNKPLMKNLFEVKAAKGLTIQYNEFNGWWDMMAVNTNQGLMMVLKASNYPSPYGDSDVVSWPPQYSARTGNISVLNNRFKWENAGGIHIGAGNSDGGMALETGPFYVRNNFFEADDITRWLWYVNNDIRKGSGQEAEWIWGGADPSYEISNNTVYVSGTSSTGGMIHTEIPSTSKFLGTGRIFANIVPKNSSGFFATRGETADSTAALESMLNCNPCTTSEVGYNVAMGAATTNYPAGALWTGCASASACSQDWDSTQGYGVTLFRNRGKRDFRIKAGHTFARNGYAARDIGADMNAVPDIRNLDVTATDRLVRFSYAVTPVMADVPCVAEVNTSPDFLGSYAGELGAIATHYRKDADDYDAFPRSPGKIRRNIVIGHTVALTAGTAYYYRLSCGGWSERGSFTTAATKSSTATLSVSRASLAAATWGYAYSRATDEITDDAAMSCASNTCTATATRGRLVYWRAGAGPVQTVLVQ